MFCFLFYISILLLIDCTSIKLIEVQPRNVTAVEGYNTTLKYSFDGYYSLLKMWVLFPYSQTPVLLDDQCCWVKHRLSCSDGPNLSDCCIFKFIINSNPHINESGTAISYSRNFANEGTVWMSKWHVLSNVLLIFINFS